MKWVDNVNWPPLKSFKAGISSISTLLECCLFDERLIQKCTSSTCHSKFVYQVNQLYACLPSTEGMYAVQCQGQQRKECQDQPNMPTTATLISTDLSSA